LTGCSKCASPFVLEAVVAGALKVPGNRLSLITPPASGGSFGIKQAVLSYIVLLAAASRALGVPVKWIEDRAEHLAAASAAGDRARKGAAPVKRDGELIRVRF